MLGVVVVLCLALTGSLAQTVDPWPQHYATPSLSSSSRITTRIGQGWTANWHRPLQEYIGDMLLAAEDTLVVLTNTLVSGYTNGYIVAIDVTTGQVKWNQIRTTFLGNVLTGAIASSNGKLFVSQNDGPLSVYDIKTGTQLGVWGVGSLYDNDVPALGPNGVVYLNAEKLYALDFSKNPNGTVLWSAPTNSGTLGGNTVSVGPDGTIWVLGRRRIIGVSSSTGQTKCTYTYNDGEATGLVVDGLGNVYVFYLGNYFSQTQLVALSNECKLLWNVSQPIFITTAETVGMALSPKGDALYLSSTHEPKLIAFNTANGKVNWEYPVKSSQNPSVGPDGTIYVAAGASGLIAISPTGSTLWKRHERAIQTVVLSANNDLFTASGVLSVEAIPASHRLK